MRDVFFSGLAGFLASCAGGYAVHRELWKSAEKQGKQLDAIVGNAPTSKSVIKNRKETETFESYIVRRARQWWNAGVDNVHARLLNFPETADRLVNDFKGQSSSSNDSK